MQTRQSTNSVASSSSVAEDQSLVHVPMGSSDLARNQPSSSWQMSEPFKSFADSPAITPLTSRAISSTWINLVRTDEWKAVVNGCPPFELQNEKMWAIVETFRRGEGSLKDQILGLAEWKSLSASGQDSETEVAERDGMYFFRRKGPREQVFTVTTGVNEETHRKWATTVANLEERFEFVRSTAGKWPSTQLVLWRRSSPASLSYWKFICQDSGAPIVFGGQSRHRSWLKETCYSGKPASAKGDIAYSFYPSDLKPLTQHPHLSRLRDVTSASK